MLRSHHLRLYSNTQRQNFMRFEAAKYPEGMCGGRRYKLLYGVGHHLSPMSRRTGGRIRSGSLVSK
jgi:hypothetical protein